MNSIVELVNNLSTDAIGNLITGGATIVAILGLIYQSRTTNKQLRLQNIIEYTKRYQEIILNFPENINEKEFKIDDLDEGLKSKTLRYMRAYFDLCFEEFVLYKKGYIDNEVWNIWSGGIFTALSKPSFQQAWSIINKDSQFGLNFENFINSIIHNNTNHNIHEERERLYSKERVKDIFDNIKQFMVCSAVLYAAVFMFRIENLNPVNEFVSKVEGTIFLLGVFWLLYLNSHHAVYVLFPNFEVEYSKKKRILQATIVAIYIILYVPFVLSVTSKNIPKLSNQNPTIESTKHINR